MEIAREPESLPPNTERAPLQNVSSLLTDAFRLYTSHFPQIFKVGLVLFVISLLETVSFHTTSASFWAIAFTAVMLVAVVVFGFLGYLAFIFILSKPPGPSSGSDISVLFARSWSLLGPYSWLTLLLTFVFLGGGILLVIPAIIASVYLSFSIFAFAIDERRGMNALILSAHVVRGKWLAVFGRILTYAIISGLTSLLALFIAYGLAGSSQSLVNSLIASAVTASISSFFLAPFNLSYFYILYQALKESSGPIEEAEVDTTSRYILWLAVVGLIFVLILAVLASSRLTQFLPQLFSVSGMPASVISPFIK